MKVYTIILKGFDQLEFPRHISRWDLRIYPRIIQLSPFILLYILILQKRIEPHEEIL